MNLGGWPGFNFRCQWKHPRAQEFESGTAIHLALDHFQPIDLPFYLPLPGARRARRSFPLHDATETGVSISGIFQAADDL